MRKMKDNLSPQYILRHDSIYQTIIISVIPKCPSLIKIWTPSKYEDFEKQIYK